ncbi:GNAT family N-acetyltransferase [bacterium]|nr:GNAT family N-acetyltransferase [bacterium]
MEIRKPKIEEAEEVSNLLINTIKNVNSKDHNLEQIESWLPSNSVERLKQKFTDNKRSIFVLVDKKEIMAYLCMFLESKLITSLYVKHTEIGKGYGKKLLQFAEDFAKQNNLDELKLDSSTTAFNFYKSQAYIAIKESNHDLNGVKIPIIEMYKKL